MKKFLLSCLATMAVFGLGAVGNPANAQGPENASELLELCKGLVVTGDQGSFGSCMQEYSAADAACFGRLISDISSLWPGPKGDFEAFRPPKGALAKFLEFFGSDFLDEFLDSVCGVPD